MYPTHLFRNILAAALLIAAAPSGGAAQAAGSVPAAVRAPSGMLPITSTALAAGFGSAWNTGSQQLTCTGPADTLVFFARNHFYSVNGSFRQLRDAPFMAGGALVLPGPLSVAVFNPFCGDKLQWQAALNAVVIKPDTARAGAGADTGREIAPPPVSLEPPRHERAGIKPGKETFKLVVIDPGHGGADPGAIGPDGIQEKDVVLKIGLDLRDLLREKCDCTVLMTRDKDEFVPLRDRTKFANDKKADLFVSIHANSVDGNKEKKLEAHGFRVYFLSQAKNEQDKLAAMTENAVVELEQKPQDINFLQNIIVEMMNNEYLTESQGLSIQMSESMTANLKKVTKLGTGVGQAPFWVLNGAYMPSVLVETAFISHPQEEKLLADPSFQKKIASALCDAILDFKKKYRIE